MGRLQTPSAGLPVLACEGVAMECRKCGRCCVQISISSPIPGMPDGKPAGVRCIHLTEANRCALFGKPNRPGICRIFKPNPKWCGHWDRLEAVTDPNGR